MSQPLYTLSPAEPTDTGWSHYNNTSHWSPTEGRYVPNGPTAYRAAQARAHRLGISVTVEKNGKPWRMIHPSGQSERMDLGPGRGAFRGKPGHRRAVMVNHSRPTAAGN